MLVPRDTVQDTVEAVDMPRVGAEAEDMQVVDGTGSG